MSCLVARSIVGGVRDGGTRLMLPNGKVWRSFPGLVSLARSKGPIRSEIGTRARAHIHHSAVAEERHVGIQCNIFSQIKA